MVNEKRLIDANALMGDIQEELEYECKAYTAEQNKWIDAGLRIAANNIRRQPTVDAVEVVHGRWKPVDHDGSWRVDMCSICHRRRHYVDYDQPYQYCPNCGAEMEL